MRYPARLLCLLTLLTLSGLAWSQSTHSVFFQGTDYELNVYRIHGEKPGKTLLLIGGIQGDEPGGYLSADSYSDIELEKGNLIIVPRANLKSIILNDRGPDGDMNRQFHDHPKPNPMLKVVAKLKQLMNEADLFLHLHDGWGFHYPKYIDAQRNPKRYGQSLIADAENFTCTDGRVLALGKLARRILERVNAQIENPRHHLHFFNTRTHDPDTPYPDMRKTATYYALRHHCLPAYGVESSKNIKSIELRILYHNLVINEFMRYLGIVPLTPKVLVPSPHLEFAEIQVNGEPKLVRDGDELRVHRGDRISVVRIGANSPRGISCDVLGHGGLNDLGHEFTIRHPTRILFRKESHVIGRVRLAMGGETKRYVAGKTRVFVIEVNGQRRLALEGEHLALTPHDTLRLISSFSDGNNAASPEINFKGWVPKHVHNSGDDRNYLIHLSDHLQKKFSVDHKGRLYPVVASTHSGRKLGQFYIELQND
jgi:hypothetical protein